ncbi:MAG: GNAT family N-acetyltransferase [Propionibacteriaceae bacterium]|nr:GNAT family N-acetyltransferase [Propionibacteriaceae bacterium]
MPRIIDAGEFPASHDWPVTLRYGRLMLAPFRRRDIDEVALVRTRNISWLSPWDATAPNAQSAFVSAERRIRFMWDQASHGLSLPWLLRWSHQGRHPVIGQCTVSNIVYGSAQSASIGYWIDKRYAGRSITPTAVALATDYAFFSVGLHRMEICIRPENTPSLRVVEKLGFRYEGRRLKYIHIAGAWRDHEVFALTAEEVPDGLLARAPDMISVKSYK